jgi:hypothetical protein
MSPPLSCCSSALLSEPTRPRPSSRGGCAGASQRARRTHCRCREGVSRPPRADVHPSLPAAECVMGGQRVPCHDAARSIRAQESRRPAESPAASVAARARLPEAAQSRTALLQRAVVDARRERGRHWLLLSLALFPSLPPLIAHTTHTTAHFLLHPTPRPPFDSYAPVFRLPVSPTDHQTTLPSSLPPPPPPPRRTPTSTAPILAPPAHATRRHPRQHPSATP